MTFAKTVILAILAFTSESSQDLIADIGAEQPNSIDTTCVYPGVCSPPDSKYSWVAPVTPR